MATNPPNRANNKVRQADIDALLAKNVDSKGNPLITDLKQHSTCKGCGQPFTTKDSAEAIVTGYHTGHVGYKYR
jgi:hypothetical protein